MSLAIYCPVCNNETMGKTKKVKLKIRTSQQVTSTLKTAIAYCPCCFRKITLSAHIVTVQETHFWDSNNTNSLSNDDSTLLPFKPRKELS